MKKKSSILLLVIGILLFCLGVTLAIVSTGSKDILGGADWPTFCFVFFYEHRGLYSILSGLGGLCFILSFVFRIGKKRH